MMDEFWKEALKISPKVAIPGILIWGLMHLMFQEAIVSFFDTEKIFVLTLVLLVGLLICLLAAVKQRVKSKAANKNKVVINKSTIQGDIVMGDKHESKK